MVEARWWRRTEVEARWWQRTEVVATHGGAGGRRRTEVEALRRAGGRRRTEVEALGRAGGGAGAMQAAAQGRSLRRQPDGVSSVIRSPEARRFVCGGFGQEWPSPALLERFFRPLVPVCATNRYQRCIGTGLCHQPVPKVHQKLRANRGTFGTGFCHQPVPKGFSLLFFSCFIKTTITFERKVQMT